MKLLCDWLFVRGITGGLPSQRASNAQLWYFLLSSRTNCWINSRSAGDLKWRDARAVSLWSHGRSKSHWWSFSPRWLYCKVALNQAAIRHWNKHCGQMKANAKLPSLAWWWRRWRIVLNAIITAKIGSRGSDSRSRQRTTSFAGFRGRRLACH